MLLGEPLDGAGKPVSGMRGSDPAWSVTRAGVLPCEVFSRLSRATRRSHGSLPRRVSRCPYGLRE